ncbi:hypothetical protein NIASO_10445 [Niabella soli DSM 19437]|uniref:Uncharacterized protein n=1 Tax=Niabella soli DSM 19437 TaxID=929713 RepID=W0F886_9BACT|nr:hypothetical protein NIASO_10445 [Niabella soli DSM 19437]
MLNAFGGCQRWCKSQLQSLLLRAAVPLQAELNPPHQAAFELTIRGIGLFAGFWPVRIKILPAEFVVACFLISPAIGSSFLLCIRVISYEKLAHRFLRYPQIKILY